MKEIETSTVIIEEDVVDESSGERVEVEIVDMRLEVVLARRHERIMARTLRIRTSLTSENHTASNSHRITF